MRSAIWRNKIVIYLPTIVEATVGIRDRSCNIRLLFRATFGIVVDRLRHVNTKKCISVKPQYHNRRPIDDKTPSLQLQWNTFVRKRCWSALCFYDRGGRSAFRCRQTFSCMSRISCWHTRRLHAPSLDILCERLHIFHTAFCMFLDSVTDFKNNENNGLLNPKQL